MSNDQEQRKEDPTAAEHHAPKVDQTRADAEAQIKRNPHPDFKKVEGSRPDWEEKQWTYTKTPKPDWKLGDGANDGGESLKHEHVEIDPYEEGRPAVFNYKLLISAIIPRPIGFISTLSKDGTSSNLAPYSYTQVVNHDPPIFIVGHAGGIDNAKDSLKNLVESGECVLNVVSEHFIEAANFTSVNAPFNVSEWALTGLTPAPCSQVKASRVKEAIFAAECKLIETKEFESRTTPGKKTGVLAILEGVRFWAREDAINKDKNILDPAILKPMARLGGITYGRINEGIELPRPEWKEHEKRAEELGLNKSKTEGQ